MSTIIQKLTDENRELALSLAAAQAEAQKWKAAHDEMVARNALLRDRPDLPLERTKAYSLFMAQHEEVQAEAQELREKLGRVEALPKQWRAQSERVRQETSGVPFYDGARTGHISCADQLDAALSASEPVSPTPSASISAEAALPAESVPCRSCGGRGFIDLGPKTYEDCADCEQPAERESLPLMARREWMPNGAVLAGWVKGYCFFYDGHSGFAIGRRNIWDGTGDDKLSYRIADTDEHGLPVVEREAGMPLGAKYRWWHTAESEWVYESAWFALCTTEQQRIEDFNAQREQEGQR